MSRRSVISAALAALSLLAILVVGFGWFSSGPTLTIYLRCDKEVAGTLSVVIVSGNGESGDEKHFDLGTFCGSKAGIEIDHYRSEESLQFTLERVDGETSKLTAEYDYDIHRYQHEFYTIIKITNTPPFIANDRI
ncbi:hypothetical protein [Candidatus Thiosymbion oneisti]|uniref:hypothetical protein n=1 Tax=Candidatus Thiosymbion oneisti TaxID=589554 RepID=UPI000B7D95CC|nr:hypothetical protein [Candidatus Thiosymbion oneisti]